MHVHLDVVGGQAVDISHDQHMVADFGLAPLYEEAAVQQYWLMA